MRLIKLGILCAALFATQSHAVLDFKKFEDRKWYVYACKHASIGGIMVAKMEAKFGPAAVDAGQEKLKKSMAEMMPKVETMYKFDSVDAQFIADMVFSIRTGLKEVGDYEMKTILNAGVDVCYMILEDMHQEMVAASK